MRQYRNAGDGSFAFDYLIENLIGGYESAGQIIALIKERRRAQSLKAAQFLIVNHP